ncbi:MAG TPA: sigma-54 dependent transcriptional regulator [Longimicrobiales bacterium]|nr:sigma-54 dependent transcriptional regulator [Longimicrobiales bacterium]
MAATRVLILDDDALIRTVLSDRLERRGCTVRVAATVAEARCMLRAGIPDLALLDIMLPDGTGTDLLPELAGEFDVPCIMMTAHATVENAVGALKLGARDFLEKPISYDRLDATVAAALEVTALRREVRALREQGRAEGTVIGASPAMQDILRLVERVAPAEHTTVLIEGETGTGKGVIARLIHKLSPRAAQPFINITCTALAETIMESELFGHEKGAFTDARALKRGLVELADRGTLFLDEVGELSPRLQGKLLQFIEERTFRRVGGTRDLHVDTRLIAATNRDLERAVAAGAFRADLFYRLRVVPLALPPLRDRVSDVPEFAKHFVEAYSRELGKRVRRITPDALDLLMRHPWPGNVRELRNVIERGVLLADGDSLDAAALPPELRAPRRRNGDTGIDIGPDGVDIDSIERNLLREALRRAEGNRTSAGRLLGLSRHQIRNRLKKYGDQP